MSITVSEFGRNARGEEAKLYTITGKNGFSASFTDSGAIWVSAVVPSGEGFVDVLLGCDSADDYAECDAHLGAVVGRVANRTCGQDGPCFELDGIKYTLPATDKACGRDINLHSGPDFYEQRIWKAEPGDDGMSVIFSLDSPDGDQGYPGNLSLKVRYEVTEDNTVKIIYDALSDADTLLNPTNHAYFNLNGNGSGTIWDHSLCIDSDHYTETVDAIPTGRILPVEGTKYDYTAVRRVENELDDNLCAKEGQSLKDIKVRCTGDESGIVMEVRTDMPGIQVYTSNFLDVARGKGGVSYGKGDGICFESQFYVNAVNTDNPEFKKPVLKAGVPFHSETWYTFK